MKRHPRSFWEKLIAEVDAGAASAEVARVHRVRESTLRWWRTELRRRARSASLRLLPVSAATEGVPKRLVEIAVGGAVIRVEEGADVAYIGALAKALRSTC